jgi:hypothetical protein
LSEKIEGKIENDDVFTAVIAGLSIAALKVFN